MTAREWFEAVRAYVVEIWNLELDIEEIETQTEPHGHQPGSMGGGPATTRWEGSTASLT